MINLKQRVSLLTALISMTVLIVIAQVSLFLIHYKVSDRFAENAPTGKLLDYFYQFYKDEI